MTIELEDIVRLTAEMSARFSPEDGGYDLDQWADSIDLAPNALHKIIRSSVDAVREQMQESIQSIVAEAMESSGEMGVDNDDPMGVRVGYGAMNIGEFIANSCYHCFVLGWELSAQYGKR